MKTEITSIMPVVPTEAYLLNGITYAPHYLEADAFMAPGGIKRTKTNLLSQGATQCTLMLWERGRLNHGVKQ